MQRFTGDCWKTGAAALLVATLLAGCAVGTPVPAEPALDEAAASPSGEPTAAEPAVTEPVDDETASAATESSGTVVQVEPLTFAVQQDTFLSHIQDAIDEIGQPQARYYVETTAPDNVTWQGERLVYADGDVYFLQQAGGDGLTAVRVDAAAGSAPENVAAQLQAQPAAGGPADVQVQFVRARVGDAESSTWSFDVTVAHPDTGWEDYVDGWQVETLDGRILGVRILLHPHVNEQPFTRSLSNVAIPEAATEIRIRPHDLVSGYGSATDPILLSEASVGDWFEVVR